MIVSPDLYTSTTGGSQGNYTMNCGLQYDSRHAVFQGLGVDSHWMTHHGSIASVKPEPREEPDYHQYLKPGGPSTPPASFQAPLTPPGLSGAGYAYPTPPQAEYRSPRPAQEDEPMEEQPGKEPDQGVDFRAKASGSPRLTPPGSVHSPTPESVEKHDAADNSQSSNSENEFFENGDSLRRLQMALQRTGMMPEEKLQCPMCEFTCSIRAQFNEHLMSHETKCPACDFAAETSDKLKEHVRANHEHLSEEDVWGEEEPGLTTPKVNSQGKVKTFRCKQCDFSAVTKLEFWDHSRTHIKQERLLTCPKCPFVTEYKHHLEYHLRNHFGSKPFKCDKCSYSCVNKSMLNSHLKSHSNIYQFRCSDCTYATKYCHSLKLHLRKYGHTPAMVLNPDGTPNPLPIVDVYGTRRGPKQKGKQQPQPVEKPQVSVPLFNPYSLLPAQMPYYNLLNGFSPFPFTPEVKMEEKNNNIEKDPSGADEKDERTPLDLTCPEQPESDNGAGPDTPAMKNRRKGKAFKLERIALRLQQQSDDEDGANNKSEQAAIVAPKSPDVKSCEADSEAKPEPAAKRTEEKPDEYNCTYCDISFRDIVMYTMHMGYHGYQDPFTCNMCGQQTTDKVAFFLHIARTSHS